MNPTIHIAIQQGSLNAEPAAPIVSDAGCGTIVRFEGVVRFLENDRELDALLYEVYEPMTSRQLRMLCEQIAGEFNLRAITLEHSVGIVRVGEVSFRLIVQSAHRKEALAATDTLIDRMKQEVAIWKRPVWQHDMADTEEPPW